MSTPATARKPIHRKVKAAGAGGTLAVVIAFFLDQAHVKATPVEATALAAVLSSLAAYLRR